MVKFQMRDGRVVDAAKDCECLLHSGPHWMHSDEAWKQVIADMRAAGNVAGAFIEDQARIREKRYQMESRGIERIITVPDPPQDPQPEFVPPPPHTLGYVLGIIKQAIDVFGPDALCQFMGSYGATGTIMDFGVWEREPDMVNLYTDLCSG